MIFHALVRRQRYLLTLIAIALSIFYSLPVFSHPGRFFRFRQNSSIQTEVLITQHTKPEPQQALSLLQQLDLTGEQQQKIKQIHRQYRQQMLKKKQVIARLQQQLSDMMVGTESIELLRAKNQQLNLLRQEMGRLRFESMLATREILTPQQRQKFRELVQEVSIVE
ncbi:MAG: Spy/CpxP family protein refolding chaperone [Cyanobacteria bacterium J06623_7]